MKFFIFSFITVVLIMTTGCQDQCCQKDLKDSLIVKGNLTPVAEITGVPTQMTCGTSFTANGTTSSDRDGEITNYTWTLDDSSIGTDTIRTAVLPCDDAEHTLCLSVTDNKGAKAQTCQKIAVVKNESPNITVPIDPDSCNLIPIVTYEKADAQQYKFFCAESLDHNKPIDPNTTNCKWTATKTFLNGNEQETHNVKGPVKWINVNPETFKALDLTLTVTNADCVNSITKHYVLPQDLPY